MRPCLNVIVIIIIIIIIINIIIIIIIINIIIIIIIIIIIVMIVVDNVPYTLTYILYQITLFPPLTLQYLTNSQQTNYLHSL